MPTTMKVQSSDRTNAKKQDGKSGREDTDAVWGLL